MAGKYPQAGKAEILVSQYLTERLLLSPGDQVRFRPDVDSPPTTMVVTGVYRTGVEKLDRNLAFCPPGTLVRVDPGRPLKVVWEGCPGNCLATIDTTCCTNRDVRPGQPGRQATTGSDCAGP